MSVPCRVTASGDVFPADELRIGGGDLHGDIVHQTLKILGARDEIGLAVDFDQHAQLGARVNVAADDALLGGTRGLLCRRRDAALAQNHFRLRRDRPWLSTSAFLHSIMPAPVRSRSCLTKSALISMVSFSRSGRSRADPSLHPPGSRIRSLNSRTVKNPAGAARRSVRLRSRPLGRRTLARQGHRRQVSSDSDSDISCSAYFGSKYCAYSGSPPVRGVRPRHDFLGREILLGGELRGPRPQRRRFCS